MLVVMAGLPGSGKSTVARGIAAGLPGAVVTVDAIDDALRRAGIGPDQPTGLAAYVAAEAVAEEMLATGLPVVVDAVNAVAAARRQWRDLATRAGVARVVVEVVCSDPAVHRARLEGRSRGYTALPEPTWAAAVRRREEYEPWTEQVLRLDTVDDPGHVVAAALELVRRVRRA